jgi:uracil-DNA glycosylase
MGITKHELIKLFRETVGGWEMDDDSFPPNGITTDYYPASENIFKALEMFRPEEVRYVILGQDPYPNTDKAGQPYATGIAFDIPNNSSPMADSFTELAQRLKLLSSNDKDGVNSAVTKYRRWIQENHILMLNSALTVEPQNAGSHLKDWKEFIAQVIRVIRDTAPGVKYVAWGNDAGNLLRLALEGTREFSWACHPQARSGAISFRQFWEMSPIGADLRDRAATIQ